MTGLVSQCSRPAKWWQGTDTATTRYAIRHIHVDTHWQICIQALQVALTSAFIGDFRVPLYRPRFRRCASPCRFHKHLSSTEGEVSRPRHSIFPLTSGEISLGKRPEGEEPPVYPTSASLALLAVSSHYEWHGVLRSGRSAGRIFRASANGAVRVFPAAPGAVYAYHGVGLSILTNLPLSLNVGDNTVHS